MQAYLYSLGTVGIPRSSAGAAQRTLSERAPFTLPGGLVRAVTECQRRNKPYTQHR